MQEKVSLYSYITLGILILVGVLLVVALVAFLMQEASQQLPAGNPTVKLFTEDPLAPIGAFFFMAFEWTAFMIPLFLFINAFLLLIRPFPRRFLLLINLLLIPFLTLTLFVRMISADSAAQLPPLVIRIKEQFGQFGGAALILLIFMLELVVIYQVFNLSQVPIKNRIKKAAKTTGQSRFNSHTSRLTEDEKKKRRDTNNYAFSPGGSPNIFIPPDPRLQAFQKSQQQPEPSMGNPVITPIIKQQQSPALPATPQQGKIELSGPVHNLPAPENAEPNRPALGDQGRHIEEPVYEDAVYEHVEPQPDPAPKQEPQPLIMEPLEFAEAGFEEEEEDDENYNEAIAANIIQPAKQESEPSPVHIPEPADKDHGAERKRSAFRHYVVPENLLKEYKDGEYWKIDKDTSRAGEILMNTLLEFNITAELTGICKGPVITMFEILPSPGVKLSKIVNLADNIALRLAASSVRIVAPIPGKHAVGIEIPNKKRAVVSFKELISLPVFKKNKYEIPVVLGKDISGEAQIIDLVHTPHLLIAGATGSGKSVCVNSLIASILFKKTPDEVRLMLIDPKIVELKFFNDIPHLLTPVITEPKRSFQALQYCLCEMERRYSLLDSIGVRDVASYNRKIKEKKLATISLPYIVIVIDEFADLMATTGKELESTIARLTAMSRAVGIHLVLATQRPSVDVITGLIKANIPSRIAFMVASKFDSRIIIDSIGAEKLLGKGDMLFTSAWNPFPVRIQGSFLTEEEVEAVTDHVKTLGEPDYIDDEIFYDDEEDNDYVPDGEADPLLDEAVDIILSANKASTSYLQRKLKIGYNRAARLIEDMEQRGIVGPPNGSKARDILHIPDRK